MDAIEETCAPDVEFDWSRRLLDPMVLRGYDGIRRFLEEVDGIFDEIVFEEDEVLSSETTCWWSVPVAFAAATAA